MKLTQFSDYSLRVLLYLGLKKDQATVAEISQNFKISRNHLVKVVHQLGKNGMLKSLKGKDGGILLEPHVLQMKIGEIILKTEPNFHIVECFDKNTNTCPIVGVCALEKSLQEAFLSFIASLNRQTLGDLLKSPAIDTRKKILGISY